MHKTKYTIYKHYRSYRYRLHKKAGSQTALPAHEVGCPECGETVFLPDVRSGKNGYCPTCHYQLASVSFIPYLNPLAYATTSLIFITLTFSFVFMGIRVGDASFTMTLFQGVSTLFKEGYDFLSYIFLSTTFLTPALLILTALYVYQGLYFKKNLPFLIQAIKFILRIKPWVMIDIFVISTFISMVKIKTLANMFFGLSFWAIILLGIFILRTSTFIHPHWLFYQYKKILNPNFKPLKAQGNIACEECFFFNSPNETHCQVCCTKLHKRKPHHMQISLALLIGALAFYLPANIYPMMITVTPISTVSANILDGIIYMWDTDAKMIGTVIFCASILVPIIKMIAITVLLISARYKLLASAIILTRLYRIIEFIGRWSMVDIFVVTIMVTLVQLPGAFALPGSAVVYFCLVVILSMVSVTEFDIRSIWDKEKIEKYKGSSQ